MPSSITLDMILSTTGCSYSELLMLGAVIFNTLVYYFTNESQIIELAEVSWFFQADESKVR